MVFHDYMNDTFIEKFKKFVTLNKTISTNEKSFIREYITKDKNLTLKWQDDYGILNLGDLNMTILVNDILGKKQ
jgi:hypothetical protein